MPLSLDLQWCPLTLIIQPTLFKRLSKAEMWGKKHVEWYTSICTMKSKHLRLYYGSLLLAHHVFRHGTSLTIFSFNPLRKSVGWATRWYFALFSKKLYARTLCHFVELSCFTHSHYGFFVPQSKDTHRSLTDNSKMHVGPGLHKAYRHIATWLLNENRRPLLLNWSKNSCYSSLISF